MAIYRITDRVIEVGAPHPDLKYFDRLMPTPCGTTYNAYLVFGNEKTALIDPVDPSKADILMQNLEDAGLTRLDYLICLHTEQDHSGAVLDVLQRFPEAQLVGGKRLVDLMTTHHNLAAERFQVMSEGESLELGGQTLTFHFIPFAHWPDNTMVYLQEEKILFSSDLFGSHYAAPDMENPDAETQLSSAKIYYAEIMMPFRTHVEKYTKMVQALEPRVIAPAHGPLWRTPKVILDKYLRWTDDRVNNRVIIGFVSMHDSTTRMTERLSQRLSANGIRVSCINFGDDTRDLRVSAGELLHDLVNAGGVILASPTVLGGPHPNIAYAAILLNALKPKTRVFALMGSYGWGTKMEDVLNTLTAGLRVQRLPSVLVKGLPTAEELEQIDKLADDMAAHVFLAAEKA